MSIMSKIRYFLINSLQSPPRLTKLQASPLSVFSFEGERSCQSMVSTQSELLSSRSSFGRVPAVSVDSHLSWLSHSSRVSVEQRNGQPSSCDGVKVSRPIDPMTSVSGMPSLVPLGRFCARCLSKLFPAQHQSLSVDFHEEHEETRLLPEAYESYIEAMDELASLSDPRYDSFVDGEVTVIIPPSDVEPALLSAGFNRRYSHRQEKVFDGVVELSRQIEEYDIRHILDLSYEGESSQYLLSVLSDELENETLIDQLNILEVTPFHSLSRTCWENLDTYFIALPYLEFYSQHLHQNEGVLILCRDDGLFSDSQSFASRLAQYHLKKTCFEMLVQHVNSGISKSYEIELMLRMMGRLSEDQIDSQVMFYWLEAWADELDDEIIASVLRNGQNLQSLIDEETNSQVSWHQSIFGVNGSIQTIIPWRQRDELVPRPYKQQNREEVFLEDYVNFIPKHFWNDMNITFGLNIPRIMFGIDSDEEWDDLKNEGFDVIRRQREERNRNQTRRERCMKEFPERFQTDEEIMRQLFPETGDGILESAIYREELENWFDLQSTSWKAKIERQGFSPHESRYLLWAFAEAKWYRDVGFDTLATLHNLPDDIEFDESKHLSFFFELIGMDWRDFVGMFDEIFLVSMEERDKESKLVQERNDRMDDTDMFYYACGGVEPDDEEYEKAMKETEREFDRKKISARRKYIVMKDKWD